MKNYDLSKLDVLIVEDNRFFCRMLTTLVQALGVRRAHAAHDGGLALDILQRNPIDLILTDWQMEPVGGQELIAGIRTADSGIDPTIPIIAVTGHTDLATVELIRDTGANEIVAKPVSAQTIYDRIVACIERPRDFVRTEGYVGPDRRRKVNVSFAETDRRAPNSPSGDIAAEEETKLAASG